MLLRLSGFVERVSRHVTRPVLSVRPETSCAEAIRDMTRERASHALVVGRDGRILGIVTEQDVVRRMTFQLDGRVPITEAMSSPVNVMREQEFLYLAIGKMRRLGLKHLPVLNASGAPVGTIELAAALSDFEANRPLGNHVPLEALTRRDRDMLVDAFQAVRRIRSRLRSELGVEMF